MTCQVLKYVRKQYGSRNNRDAILETMSECQETVAELISINYQINWTHGYDT